MDTNLWIGGLAGVAATLLVLGGLAVVTATAGGMGEMGSMMDQCQQMMDDHDHGHGHEGGHDHGNTTDDGARAEATPTSAHPEDITPATGSLAVPA